MGFSLRTITDNIRFPEAVSLNALEQVIPQATVEAVIIDLGVQEQRVRKLPATMVLMLCVAMGLFTNMSLEQVLIKMVKGLRYIWPDDEDYQTANKSAISQARYRLGAQSTVELFHRVCKPIATEQTPGAFLFGLRLMSIDGDVEDVPDTPANEAFFGRHRGGRGDSAFPQTRAVYLCESGTHTICDAGFWPCHTSERVGGLRMLRSVKAGMLVMWDCGFHSFDMAVQTYLLRQTHFLGRLPAHVKPKFVKALPDGSYLAYIYPSDYHRKKRGERLLVRIIKYTIDDPHRNGHGELHRLITSLLDPDLYPAHTLACEYHQRWEIEITIDEVNTHQRLPNIPLRSQKPIGVIQEAYGLLIAHYAVRSVMHQAAVQAGLDPDRLSFINAVRIIRDAISEFQMTVPQQLPRLYQRLLNDIVRHRLPERDDRSNPRVVKRKMSKFKLKRKQHWHWPQPSKPFPEAVTILN
ncbi:IS4 family transposase [Neptuniibacter sp.]|uniref:IS4 family transposase n=1 Tax=Neptuniibacter sp. TaxID=1962643 RepID=UPI00262AA22A|nr:IS4 family transposase [Neptuniibacter sp.]MCP4595440.1 IS4 family transposase [Neptuniibacter sp.]